jgi:NADP-dependent 3-hydroxy acid dehydrogenase YdfG
MAITLKPVGEQVIVITGASSGIGLATAEAAAEQGAKLVLASRSGDTLEDVAIRLSRNGAEAMAVDADVGRRADIEQIAVAAIERFGRIDSWVNNAGVAIYGRLEEVSEQDSRRLFDTNFWGVVNGSLVALRHLRANGGAIINVGSEVSDAVIPLQGMYTASNHAVKGFTDSLRVEVEEVEKAPVAITLIQPTAVDPIDPSEVAEAILKGAASHTRNIKVGVMAKVNTTIAKVAPAVGEKIAAKMVRTNGR